MGGQKLLSSIRGEENYPADLPEHRSWHREAALTVTEGWGWQATDAQVVPYQWDSAIGPCTLLDLCLCAFVDDVTHQPLESRPP